MPPLGEKLSFPNGCKRVWIDVGADWSSFTSRYFTVWPGLKWGEDERSTDQEFLHCDDIVAIAIEPHCGYMRALNAIERVIPIFGAITCLDGRTLFRHYAAPGLSSVKKPGQFVKGSQGITDTKFELLCEEEVPSYRLESILKLVPSYLDIEFLKVDTQGSDLEVVQSCGEQIQRIRKIMIEVQRWSERIPALYEGQSGYDEAVCWLESQGFALNRDQSWCENSAMDEWNLVFDRQ